MYSIKGTLFIKHRVFIRLDDNIQGKLSNNGVIKNLFFKIN